MSIEPRAAEVIPDLDWLEIHRGIPGGWFYGAVLTGAKRERELDKIAADLTERGQPFIRGGVRYGPERASSTESPDKGRDE